MLNTTIHSQFHTAAVNLGDTKPATFCKKNKDYEESASYPPPSPPPPPPPPPPLEVTIQIFLFHHMKKCSAFSALSHVVLIESVDEIL